MGQYTTGAEVDARVATGISNQTYSKTYIDNLTSQSDLGVATTSVTPPALTSGAYYQLYTAGTYTNLDGIVVSSGDLDLGLVRAVYTPSTDSWTKEIIPIDVSSKLSLDDYVSYLRSELGRTAYLDGNYYPFTGSYISDTGEIVTNSLYKFSGFIPATQNDVLVASDLNYSSSSAPSVLFFDSSKTLISDLVLTSGQNPVTLNSGNIPASTAFIVFNSRIANTDAYITINGFENVTKRIDSQDEKFLAQSVENSRVSGDYYTYEGVYVSGSTQELISNVNWRCTEFIPFIDGNIATISAGFTASASAPNVLFYDSDKNFISYLTFGSSTNPYTLEESNTPTNTAFIRVNNNHSVDTEGYIEINGSKGVIPEIVSVKEYTSQVGSDLEDVQGNSFRVVGYIHKDTGILVSAATAWRCTDFIPISQSDLIYAFNTFKATSVYNAVFYDSSKGFISSLDFASNINPIRLDGSNIPASAAYVRFNSQDGLNPFFIKNGQKDLKIISDNFVPNFFNGKKWASLGDSLTAASGGLWQEEVDFQLGTVRYVRGVGSSSVSTSFNQVAVKPDGEYIDRRTNYASDAEFETALANAGYTNLVTDPTWNAYALDPGSYSLPAGSYFLIVSQGSSQDRVDTIPLDTQVVSVMFGTNDASAGMGTNVGSVDDLGGVSFLGNYRLMLDRIHTRVPSAKIILCIPPKRELEFSVYTRITYGVEFDYLREAIRELGRIYGYEVIDFSNVINFRNLGDRLQDGTHPTPDGYRMMGRYFAQRLMSINSTY